ncbi:MAG: hypothetical protein QOJ89_61 [bacterium]|jgi:hypothetical protein
MTDALVSSPPAARPDGDAAAPVVGEDREQAVADILRCVENERLDRRAAVMNYLWFVRWDRAVPGDGFVDVYGWIARDDGRSDFVLLTFWDAHPPGTPPSWTTSSARYSAEIAEIINGSTDTHNACRRVGDVFGDRVRNQVSSQ